MLKTYSTSPDSGILKIFEGNQSSSDERMNQFINYQLKKNTNNKLNDKKIKSITNWPSTTNLASIRFKN
jgi:hypothetical protein